MLRVSHIPAIYATHILPKFSKIATLFYKNLIFNKFPEFLKDSGKTIDIFAGIIIEYNRFSEVQPPHGHNGRMNANLKIRGEPKPFYACGGKKRRRRFPSNTA